MDDTGVAIKGAWHSVVLSAEEALAIQARVVDDSTVVAKVRALLLELANEYAIPHELMTRYVSDEARSVVRQNMGVCLVVVPHPDHEPDHPRPAQTHRFRVIDGLFYKISS